MQPVEPAFGLKARWISPDRRVEAEMAGYTVIEPAAVMMTHLSEVIRQHAAELLGRREVNALLDMVKKNKKGWYGPYRFSNPRTQEYERKKSYCEQAANDVLVCVGAYLGR